MSLEISSKRSQPLAVNDSYRNEARDRKNVATETGKDCGGKNEHKVQK